MKNKTPKRKHVKRTLKPTGVTFPANDGGLDWQEVQVFIDGKFNGKTVTR